MNLKTDLWHNIFFPYIPDVIEKFEEQMASPFPMWIRDYVLSHNYERTPYKDLDPIKTLDTEKFSLKSIIKY